MSKQNYSKFSSKDKNKEENVIMEEIKDNEKIEENEEIKDNEEIILEDISKKTIGTVINCEKLNVRENPNIDAKVLTIINKGETLNIDLDNSDEYFYKITTFNGIDGYCMKKYIAVV